MHTIITESELQALPRVDANALFYCVLRTSRGDRLISMKALPPAEASRFVHEVLQRTPHGASLDLSTVPDKSISPFLKMALSAYEKAMQKHKMSLCSEEVRRRRQDRLKKLESRIVAQFACLVHVDGELRKVCELGSFEEHLQMTQSVESTGMN